VDPEARPQVEAVRATGASVRSPRELFADYLTARGADDPAVAALFDELYEECVTPSGAGEDRPKAKGAVA
jgi:exonuclease SbcD